MEYKYYQKQRLNVLFESGFKRQYSLIPEEYKSNYFFKRFLIELGDVSTRATILGELESVSCIKSNFIVQENVASSEYVMCVKNKITKRAASITTKENGLVHLSWITADVDDRDYESIKDDVIKELIVNFNEDGTQVLTQFNISYPNSLNGSLLSMFNLDGNETYRVSQTFDSNTGNVISYEEFIPISISNIVDVLRKDIPQNKDLYIAKCCVGDVVRYAICFKPDGFIDEAFQKSFQAISDFGEIDFGHNLLDNLNLNITDGLIEISKEEYDKLVNSSLEQEFVQIRKRLIK